MIKIHSDQWQSEGRRKPLIIRARALATRNFQSTFLFIIHLTFIIWIVCTHHNNIVTTSTLGAEISEYRQWISGRDVCPPKIDWYVCMCIHFHHHFNQLEINALIKIIVDELYCSGIVVALVLAVVCADFVLFFLPLHVHCIRLAFYGHLLYGQAITDLRGFTDSIVWNISGLWKWWYSI